MDSNLFHKSDRKSQIIHELTMGMNKVGMWIENLDTKKVVFSEELHSIIGILKNNKITNIKEVIKGMVVKDEEDTYRELRESTTKDFSYSECECKIITNTNGTRWIKVRETESVIIDGSRFKFGSVMDITDLKKFKEEIESEKLKREKAEKVKSEFVTNVSHEIRTPLASVIGFSELLKITSNDSKHKEYAENINNAGNKLMRLIDDILELSMLEVGAVKLNLVESTVSEIIEEIRDIFKVSAKEKEIEIIFNQENQLDTRILIDKSRVRQVLFNLVGNAIKFTDNGFVKINARLRKEQKESDAVNLIISIIDTGIGISDSDLEDIFKAFKQGEGQDVTRYGGMGLGLSICEKLVKLMEGTIEVSSDVGVGSRFDIVIPNIDLAL